MEIALFLRNTKKKFIRRSQNFEIGSRARGHAHFGSLYIPYAGGGPSCNGVQNLMRIAQFVQKLLTGSQNLEIRSRDPGHAHLGVVL